MLGMVMFSLLPIPGSNSGMGLISPRKQVAPPNHSLVGGKFVLCLGWCWLIFAPYTLNGFAIGASMDSSPNPSSIMGSFPSLEALLAEDANNYLRNSPALRTKTPSLRQRGNLGKFASINNGSSLNEGTSAEEAYRRQRMQHRDGATLVSDDQINPYDGDTFEANYHHVSIPSQGSVNLGQVILEPQHVSEVEVAAKNVGQLVAGIGGLAVGAALAGSMPLAAPYGAVAYGGFNPYMQQLDCAIPGDFPGTCSVTNTEFVLIIIAVVLVLMAFCAGLCFVAFKQYKK